MTAERRTKVLLEMRPALDGHAGIPQETRLLFRGFGRFPDIEPIGLIQHHGRVLAEGYRLTFESGPSCRSKAVDRLSRVVISVEQRLGNPYLASARWRSGSCSARRSAFTISIRPIFVILSGVPCSLEHSTRTTWRA